MPPPRIVEATEISHRSSQGTLAPFFVRDTQGDMYVVKGVDGAGKLALIAELLCAELGQRFALPIADYALMTFPRGMLEFITINGASELSGGLAFASRVVPYCRELTFEQLCDIPADLQQRVLLFDIWVSNEDHYLTAQDGNVNLLVDEDCKLVVIDHNLAFDPLIGQGNFDHHIFSSQRQNAEAQLTTRVGQWLRSFQDHRYATTHRARSRMCSNGPHWQLNSRPMDEPARGTP